MVKSIKQTLLVFLSIIFIASSCQQKDSSENKNLLEGKTYKLVSAKYFENNSSVTFPATEHDISMAIYGRSHVIAVWQDTSRENSSYFITHKYEIQEDSLLFDIKFYYPDKSFVGKSFKAKFEINGDQLIVEGFDPGLKRNIKNSVRFGKG